MDALGIQWKILLAQTISFSIVFFVLWKFAYGPIFTMLQTRREKIAEFRERFANPYVAAERGYIDAVIEPSQTRAKLITALRSLENKRDSNPKKKHGNIPL